MTPALLFLLHFAAAAPDARAARVDALFERFNRAPSPGLAVAVVRDGKVVLRRGYGLADIEHNVPISPSTVFDTASIAKQFTGLAVAMLLKEGKVRLTDDIRTYIPELPDYGRPITVEQLLHHTSGVRDWPGALAAGGWRWDDVILFRDILGMAERARSLNFTPGAEHLYSNTGYNLLAEMIKRVTGKPLRAWMDEQFFRPLGMSSTRVRDDYTEVIANRAFGYAKGKDGKFHVTPDNLAAPGSSSLFSSVDDMARWLINFDEAKAGGKEAIALSRTPGKLNDGSDVPYAFGMTIGSWRGIPMATHSGGWASFDTFLVHMPTKKFGIVVLANSNTIDAQDAVIKIAGIYLEGELAPEPPQTSAEESPKPSPNPPPAIAADAPPLADFAGDYDSAELATTYRIAVKDGALELQQQRLGTIALTRAGNDEFHSTTWFLHSLKFERGADGRVTGFAINGDSRNRDLRFVRRR